MTTLIILACLAFLCFTSAILSAFSNKLGLCHSLIMDVYQNKTTLEYTIRDGEIVDSVVVFKNK